MYYTIEIDIKKESIKQLSTIKKKIIYIFMTIFKTDKPEIDISSKGITITVNVHKYIKNLQNEFIPYAKYLLSNDIFSITLDGRDITAELDITLKYSLKFSISKKKIKKIEKKYLVKFISIFEKTCYFAVDIIDLTESFEIVILSNEKINITSDILNLFFSN